MNSGIVMETFGLTRYFGKRKVVDQLTMAVPRGSVFAFIGRNGSGKTTTIRMLLGLTEPTRGSSSVLGHDSRHLPPETIARIGYMSESHALYEWMTVRQCGVYQARFYSRWNAKIFDSVVGHFHLDLRAKAGDLSRGERAGLSLAITLAPEPELLILDDPAIGLDPVARRSLLESMIYITRDSERTIFFSSHLLDDVERVADHVAILDRSVLRVLCSVDALRAGVRQFTLRYADGAAPPAVVPPIRGLLRVRRLGAELGLTIARPDDDTQRELRALGSASVDELPVALNDAIIGYLGDRGEQGFFLDGARKTETERGVA
jgi:ABC-2 type transport system ATP-binding protein